MIKLKLTRRDMISVRRLGYSILCVFVIQAYLLDLGWIVFTRDMISARRLGSRFIMRVL